MPASEPDERAGEPRAPAACGEPAERVPLAEQLPRPLAFVLGGGASFGAVQVGMLQALAEAGISPDLIVGASVGSLNGAMLAEDPHGGSERLAELWAQITREDVFPGRAVARMRTWRQHRTYVVSSEGLRALIERSITARTFEELTVPFCAVATDLASARAVHLDHGPLVPAVLASSAVPGLYPSIEVNGRELVDGGVVDNVPVEQALRMGAASAVVLDCGVYGLREDVPNRLAERIAHALGIMMLQQVLRALPAVAAQIPVLYLPGPFPMTSSPLEFTSGAGLSEQAHALSAAFLAEVELHGAGLYGQPPLSSAVQEGGS